MPQTRISVLIALIVGAAVLLTGRLAQLQMIEYERHAQRAENIRMRKTLIPGRRATIFDRHGDIVAIDEAKWELHLNYWLFTEPANALTRIDYRGGVPGYSPEQTAQVTQMLTQLADVKADRGKPKPARFRETWPGRMHPLVRGEVDATVRQLALILDVPAEPMLAKLRRVELAVNRKLAEKTGKETDKYMEIVRLGGSVGHWEDLARDERRKAGANHIFEFQENPLVFADDLDRSRVETVVELDRMFCGMQFESRAHRRYPDGEALCHVLGYLREVDRIGFTPAQGESDALENSPHYRELMRRAIADVGPEFLATHFRSDENFSLAFRWRLMTCTRGVTGIERYYDDRLQGHFGASVIEKDVHARVQRKLDEVRPEAAADMHLTIDLAVQRAAREALREVYESSGSPGAAVAIDVQTGEILAIVSYPDFDLNRLMGRSAGDQAYMTELFREGAEHGRPLFNRAIHGTVPPGSVFKILTGIAAAESGIITGPDFMGTCACTGTWQGRSQIGFSRGFTCHGGHGGCGAQTLAGALERSCNVYFHDIAHRMGYAKLREWAARFGFGEFTGVDFNEIDPWRTTNAGKPANILYPIEPANRAEAPLNGIGQGRMLVSPLQVARFLAAVATEGAMPTPHLTRGEREFAPTYIADVSPNVWAAVNEGLRRVVAGSHGTARSISELRKFEVAGKTGTAQTGRTRDGVELNYAWFAGFAPARSPAVAFAVYIEDTFDAGGAIAAPVAAKMLAALAATDEYGAKFGVLAR